MQKWLTEFKQSHDTCLLVSDRVVFHSQRFGVLPLLELQTLQLQGTYTLIDKLLGKGGALLIINLKCIKRAHIQTITEEALKLCEEAGISITYDRLIPHILNRYQTDLCPIEKLAQPHSIKSIDLLRDECIKFYQNLNQWPRAN